MQVGRFLGTLPPTLPSRKLFGVQILTVHSYSKTPTENSLKYHFKGREKSGLTYNKYKWKYNFDLWRKWSTVSTFLLKNLCSCVLEWGRKCECECVCVGRQPSNFPGHVARQHREKNRSATVLQFAIKRVNLFTEVSSFSTCHLSLISVFPAHEARQPLEKNIDQIWNRISLQGESGPMLTGRGHLMQLPPHQDQSSC